MGNPKISTITLPNGVTYDIKDPNAATEMSLSSTYDSNTKTVTLIASSLADADNEEY